MFKKRTKKATSIRRSSSGNTDASLSEANTADTATATGEQQDSIVGISVDVQDARELLRHRHKRIRGVDLTNTSTNTSTTSNPATAKQSSKYDDDPWKLRDGTGGLVDKHPQDSNNVARKSIFQSTAQSGEALNLEKRMRAYIEEEMRKQKQQQDASTVVQQGDAGDRYLAAVLDGPQLSTLPTTQSTATTSNNNTMTGGEPFDQDRMLFDHLPDTLKQEPTKSAAQKHRTDDIQASVTLSQIHIVPEVDLGDLERKEALAQTQHAIQERRRDHHTSTGAPLGAVPEDSGFFFRQPKRRLNMTIGTQVVSIQGQKRGQDKKQEQDMSRFMQKYHARKS